MIRRVLLLLAAGAGALAAAPAGFAQPDLEGLPTEGIENPKVDVGDLVLRVGFTFARADVPDVVRFRLDGAVELLNQERSGAKVEVAGHTDSVGDEHYNQQLSEQRAQAVKDYLVRGGVGEDRVTVVGYGETAPRSTNDTVEGRRLNRRVEIRVIGG
jgi:outer membrane protein OmpA-like peptidoglycan-associated protein